MPKDSLPYFTTEVEVGQIVIPAQVNDKAKQAAIAKLNDIRAQVLAGASFDTLAKEYSRRPRLGQGRRLPGLFQARRAGARVRSGFDAAGAGADVAGGAVAVRLSPHSVH